MITHPYFDIDPWGVRERGLNQEVLAQSESIFALSNGHIGMRANLDEGDPHALLGTYLNGFYEARPLPYAEAGYGYPEAGQTVVNVTNKVALYNFLSSFTGTHFVTPRAETVELGFHF